ncbi:hypothetical protein V6N13_080038 [Hibiscus sabdariffa]|uniref:Uncharacterized protein n=1 Tax=Hibiscus sabdariffa TaxID=183260 RepID=A0ABR2RTX7_9ROSI
MTRAHFHPHPHPLGISNTATDSVPVSNPKQHYWVLHSKSKEVNLKHQAPTATEKMETASLAEELSGLRKKMERLRLDKEKTEKMLDGRDGVLLWQMKEMEERGQIQKQLEIQVDRLFRLKELKSYCMRISPLKSLREKQQRGGWNINELHSLNRGSVVKFNPNLTKAHVPCVMLRLPRVPLQGLNILLHFSRNQVTNHSENTTTRGTSTIGALSLYQPVYCPVFANGSWHDGGL